MHRNNISALSRVCYCPVKLISISEPRLLLCSSMKTTDNHQKICYYYYVQTIQKANHCMNKWGLLAELQEQNKNKNVKSAGLQNYSKCSKGRFGCIICVFFFKKKKRLWSAWCFDRFSVHRNLACSKSSVTSAWRLLDCPQAPRRNFPFAFVNCSYIINMILEYIKHKLELRGWGANK